MTRIFTKPGIRCLYYVKAEGINGADGHDWHVQAEHVVDVLRVADSRLLILTECGVGALRRKTVALRASYTADWFVRLTSIQTVRGANIQFCLKQLSA